MEMELAELESKLRELESASAGSADMDDYERLRRAFHLQSLQLELQRRELEQVRQERDVARQRLESWPAMAGTHEGALSSSDELSGAALEALLVPLAVLDVNGTIIATNRAWLSEAGDAAAPPLVCGKVGENYLELHRPGGDDSLSEVPQFLSALRQILKGSSPKFILDYTDQWEQRRRCFLGCASPMPGKAGGALLANVDITARVLAQEDALRRSEEMIRAAKLRSVGILASALAHEITQPLTSVGQFSAAAVAMLDSGDTQPQELAEILQLIDSEVQRAAEVMRRLKVFMGRGSRVRLPLELHKLFAAAQEMLSQRLAEKRIELILELPDESLRINADQVQIMQVLVNLLENSIEAIDQAFSEVRRIRIRCERRWHWLHVWVSDSGPGLEPEWVESIFELFETDNIKGPGMGLAISRSIIEEHGGKLWAEIGATAGAVFHFTLPSMQEEVRGE
jgi:C4-dicarboxylate-specific signal transduction histidine kinase